MCDREREKESESDMSSIINTNNINNGQLSNDITNDPFIDTNEFTHLLTTIAFIIILDCRLLKDFQLEHIQNSKHINCRDKITKKRLVSKKLSIKDLINCEETRRILSSNCDDVKTSCENIKVILYDENSSDLNDLQLECNPLQILLDNVKTLLNITDAKVLKGGFKGFQNKYPQFCTRQNQDAFKKLVLNIPPSLINYNDYECPLETEPMTKITSYLYLGNESDAKNEELLKREGIKNILNVTKNIPCYLNDINYKRIAVNDSCDQNLRAYFEDSFDFIEECSRNNSKVLVHCQAGISRSPTVVIAYLMRKTNRKMNDIYQEIAEKRKIIGPNIVFMSQLYDYEEFLQLTSTSAINNTPIKKKFINSNGTSSSSSGSSCHSLSMNTNPNYNNIKVCN